MKRYIGWGLLVLIVLFVLWEVLGEIKARKVHERDLAEYGHVAQTEIILKNPVVQGKITVPRSIVGPSFLELAKLAKAGKTLSTLPLLVDYDTLIEHGELVPVTYNHDLFLSTFMKVSISKTGGIDGYIADTLERGTLQDVSDNAYHVYGLKKYVYQLHSLYYDYYVPHNGDEIFLANCLHGVCRYHYVIGNNYWVTVEAMLISRLHDWRHFKYNLTQALLPLIDQNVMEIRHE